MLQLTKFYEKCFSEYRKNSTGNCPVELFSYIHSERKKGLAKNILLFIDHLFWTDKRELIDDPSFDEKIKREIVLGLHLKNKIFGTYKTTIQLLRPLIEEINQSENRPARLLEIGSGSGELALALYDELKKTDLRFELTGSDIVETYIKEANRKANNRQCLVTFKNIDAFHLERLPPNSYDVLFCLHSLHHFTPAQLSKIMAGSSKVAGRAFVGVDGYRGLLNFLFMFFSGALKSLISMHYAFLHDSIVSARKLYAAKQLELLSHLSCPKSQVTTKYLRPGLTMVKIEHKM